MLASRHDRACRRRRTPPARARLPLISVLGVTQILAWGSSYYLPAVVATPIARDTGWGLPWVVGGLSLGLLIAGIVSPRVGRSIARHGGRPVLAASAVLFAAGLALMGASANLLFYLTAWTLIGAGMGAGLYDAAFSTLGRYFGASARGAIATLTLFGGFASTVCWPLSAWLVEGFGWRGACFAYAALHLVVALPAYLCLLPHVPQRRTPDGSEASRAHAIPQVSISQPFLLLAAAITLASAVTSLVSVYLLDILQARGLALAAAVGLGALVGPSQVGARAIEMALGRFYHPIWTMIAAMFLMTAGLSMMMFDLPLLAIPLVFYGAGIGIKSITRGTLPLALFGAEDYPLVIGRLALASLIAQAAAPFAGAFLIERGGAQAALAALAAVAAAALVLSLLLLAACRRSRLAHEPGAS